MADEQGMLEQFYQSAAIAERRISEERLDAALRNGIARGKQAKSRQRMKRITVSCAAAVLLMIGGAFAMNGLHFGNGIESASVHTAVNNQIPAYVYQLAGDKGMLREALDQGKYQVVEKSAAYDGYQVTVDGMVMDRKHLVLFYTSKGGSSGPIIPETPGLFTSAYDKLEFAPFIRYENRITGYYDGENYHDMLVFDTTGNESLPDEFYFAGKWGSGGPGSVQKFLEIKIPADTSKLAMLEQTMKVDKTLDFEGQKIKVQSVVQVPLRLNLNLDIDTANSKKIEQLLDWKLYTDSSGKKPLETMEVVPDQWMMSFLAPDYVKGEKLGLRGSWIVTEYTGSKKLVINTKERKILNAPDGRMKLHNIEKKNGFLRIEFSFPKIEPQMSGFVKNDGLLVDGKGIKHFVYDERGRKEDREDLNKLDLYVINIENLSYPQPLTFDFYEYPGDFIQHPFDLTIQ
ncbi:DUF4179 domain-containing protein [Paenibacillus azoreducens]|uniref:DUF4179 domain-containing protein n=1 Tax=Paenibacillus azoreducens TaxID=116718 RepID=A0A919YMT9_9BACL|nr:DUF4179 domain-containing protein [Paenibacillus azoreducens]GIO51112.1 hypothetical protein J34TS1_58770 [Paenibacillus azoreducens]